MITQELLDWLEEHPPGPIHRAHYYSGQVTITSGPTPIARLYPAYRVSFRSDAEHYPREIAVFTNQSELLLWLAATYPQK